MKDLTLSTLARGALEEQFQHAMGQVLANIEDPNTPAKKVRTITISIGIAPDETRKKCNFDFEVVPNLANIYGAGTVVALGRDKGVLVAREAMTQEELFANPIGRPEAVANDEKE